MVDSPVAVGAPILVVLVQNQVLSDCHDLGLEERNPILVLPKPGLTIPAVERSVICGLLHSTPDHITLHDISTAESVVVIDQRPRRIEKHIILLRKSLV